MYEHPCSFTFVYGGVRLHVSVQIHIHRELKINPGVIPQVLATLVFETDKGSHFAWNLLIGLSRLVSKPQGSCLCLPSTEITRMLHHAQLFCF